MAAKVAGTEDEPLLAHLLFCLPSRTVHWVCLEPWEALSCVSAELPQTDEELSIGYVEHHRYGTRWMLLASPRARAVPPAYDEAHCHIGIPVQLKVGDYGNAALQFMDKSSFFLCG